MLLLELWQSKHRPHLHHPECWSANRPSLTYVPTGAGFTGKLEMVEAEHPLFHPEQLDRFGGRLVVLSVGEDSKRGMVWEEIVIEGAVHQGQWDWLIPGQPATRRQFTVAMAFTAQYEGSLLREVRVWWDQVGLLEQLGVKCPIDGRSCAQRVLHPNPNNANFALKALQQEKITLQSDQLPPLKPVIPHKALVSTVFTDDPAAADKPVIRSPKALTSTIQLTDEYDDYAPRVIHNPVEILPPPQDPAPVIPSIAVDPHKFASKVFSAPSPFKPPMRYHPDRFESRLFQDRDEEVQVHEPRSVKSKVEESEEEVSFRPSVKINQAHLKSQFTFG